MSRFCPDKFTPKTADIDWAIKTFKVDKEEVLRQLELMRDHEFRRSYTDWNRVFRNWLRKADEINTFKRAYVPRTVEQVSEAERIADAQKAWAQMKKYGAQ